MSAPMGHDMSKYWRLVSTEGGSVTGTWWVTRPDSRGKAHVKAIDVTIWHDEQRTSGRIITDATVFIDSGEVDLSAHMVGASVRDDVMSRATEFKAAAVAAAECVAWGDDDE